MFRVIQESYFNSLIHADHSDMNVNKSNSDWYFTSKLNKLIFSFLSPCSLVNTGRVCGNWKAITSPLLASFDVRKISPCLKVFEASDWIKYFPKLEIVNWPDKQPIILEEPLHNPQVEFPFLEAYVAHLNEKQLIEENLGITILTVPLGLTMETFAKHINSLDEQRPHLISLSGLPGKITRSWMTPTTDRLVITNHNLKETVLQSSEKRNKILTMNGFRSVYPIEATILLATTFFASGVRLYARESSSYSYVNGEYYGSELFIGNFSEEGFVCDVGTEFNNPGRYGEAGAFSLANIFSVSFQNIFHSTQNGILHIGNQLVSLNSLSQKGSFLGVFMPSAPKQIIQGVGNNQLVIKTFKGITESYEEVKGYMRTSQDNYHKIQGLASVAIIYNSHSLTEKCYYIQEYVANAVDPLNIFHIAKAQEFFFIALQNSDIPFDLHPDHLRVTEDGIMKLISFEKGKYKNLRKYLISDALTAWCKLYRKTGADRQETSNFLNRFTKGFDIYGYDLQENDEIIDGVFK